METTIECQTERGDEFPGRGKRAVKGTGLSHSPPVSESVLFRHAIQDVRWFTDLPTAENEDVRVRMEETDDEPDSIELWGLHTEASPAAEPRAEEGSES